MKLYFSFCVILIMAVTFADAQEFITRGKIEFEIKRNNKRINGSTDASSRDFYASMPEFDVSYRDLIFAWNRSIYQPGRRALTPSMYGNENSAYVDLDKQQTIKKTSQFSEQYVFEDSVKKVKWKIENETRKIAGFTCRKAVGRIYNSVYVVAFYCPEVIPQGGPEMFSGLPGMILGLAIPRYYTTWFATKIEIANIDEAKIIPPVTKKNKQYSITELSDILYKKHKEAGWWKDVTLSKVKESLTAYVF